MRPGFDTELRETPVPRSTLSDLSVGFFVDIADKGRTDAPELVLNPDHAAEVFGARRSDSDLMDTLETAFAEGLSRAYVVRVVGAGADKATHSFSDSTPAATLAIDSVGEGPYYNGIRVAIETVAATRRLLITHTTDEDVNEVTPFFSTKADIVTWLANNSKVVRGRSLAPNTLPVAVAATALTGGDDDIPGISNTEWDAGLARFSLLLGPGQVAFPGRTTEAAHTSLLAHGATHNRRAVCDAPNDDDAQVLIDAADAVRAAAGANTRFGAMFGPWDVIPGLVSQTTRIVPPCGRVMGTIARVDTTTGNPNTPAAGDEGRAQYVLNITATFTDDEYTALNDAGVNMSRFIFGDDLQVYGFRTLVDPEADPRWVEFSGSRTVMYATSGARRIMAGFAFDQIDGQGHKFAELEGAVGGMLLPLHTMGALHGATPQESYRVDAGANINTPVRVQSRELRVVMALKTSPFAEHVVTEIVRRSVTEAV